MTRFFLLAFLMFSCLASRQAPAWTLNNEIEVPEERQKSLAQTVESNRIAAIQQFKKTHWGLEIITAGGTFAQPESILGHSLLRFLDDDNDPMNDLVVGFEMLPVDTSKTISKAIDGGYEALPVVKELSTYLRQYALKQSRSTSRLILPSTPEMILKIKEVVLRMITVTDLQGDYIFHRNNCATLLLKLLGSAGYPTPWMLTDIPSMMEQRMRNSMMIYAPAIRLPSVSNTIWKCVCGYLKDTKQIVSCSFDWWRQKVKKLSFDFDSTKRVLADDRFWKYLIEKASPMEMGMLVHFWPDEYLSSEINGAQAGDLYIKLLEFQTQNQELLAKWNPRTLIPSLPRELYSLCSVIDKDCRQRRIEVAIKLWPKEKLMKLTHRFDKIRDREMDRTANLTEPGRKAITAWLTSAPVIDMIEFSQELRR